MLRAAWTELIDENFEKLAAAGFGDLRPSHRLIIREMFVSNLRPSELAARLGLSKQAVNDLVREFEAMGYITLEPDPDDRRAKRIVATDRGWRTVQVSLKSSNATSRRWAKQDGEARYAVFEEVLREIVTAQDLSR